MFKLFSFIQNRKKLRKNERVCNDHDYCYVEMFDGGNKILKCNYGEKSLKAPFLKYLIHTPSGYSLFTICSFDAAKNKLDCYIRKDCIKNFCKDLREHAMKIINY